MLNRFLAAPTAGARGSRGSKCRRRRFLHLSCGLLYAPQIFYGAAYRTCIHKMLLTAIEAVSTARVRPTAGWHTDTGPGPAPRRPIRGRRGLGKSALRTCAGRCRTGSSRSRDERRHTRCACMPSFVFRIWGKHGVPFQAPWGRASAASRAASRFSRSMGL